MRQLRRGVLRGYRHKFLLGLRWRKIRPGPLLSLRLLPPGAFLLCLPRPVPGELLFVRSWKVLQQRTVPVGDGQRQRQLDLRALPPGEVRNFGRGGGLRGGLPPGEVQPLLGHGGEPQRQLGLLGLRSRAVQRGGGGRGDLPGLPPGKVQPHRGERNLLPLRRGEERRLWGEGLLGVVSEEHMGGAYACT